MDLASQWRAAYSERERRSTPAAAELAAEALSFSWGVERDVATVLDLLAAAGESGLEGAEGVQPVKLVITISLLLASGFAEYTPDARFRLIPEIRRRLAVPAAGQEATHA